MYKGLVYINTQYNLFIVK